MLSISTNRIEIQGKMWLWFDWVLTSISRWKSNKSIFCQFDPSNARIFQYLLTCVCEKFYQHYLVIGSLRMYDLYVCTCAHLHNEITSKNEKIRKSISRGRFFVISVSSDSKNVCCAKCEKKDKKTKTCLDERRGAYFQLEISVRNMPEFYPFMQKDEILYGFQLG